MRMCLKLLISIHCNKASNQLNAIGRIQKYKGFKEKEFLFNSFAYSNFNYCPFIWHFCSSKSLYNIKKIQKQALRLLHNNFASDYGELLKKIGKTTMEIKYLWCLAIEIFKTVNNLNPYYMKETFSKTTNLTNRPLDKNFKQNNTTKYRNNSLQSLGPHVWNYLPSEIKEKTEYEKFKNYMNDWFGLKCKCNMWFFLNA